MHKVYSRIHTQRRPSVHSRGNNRYAFGNGLAAAMALLFALTACSIQPPDTRSDFQIWLGEFRQDALAQGIRPATLDRTLTGLEPVAEILNRDRSQPEFALTYSEYSDRIVKPAFVEQGRKLGRVHAKLLGEIAQTHGVPAEIVLAIWAIESRFGARQGTTPVLPALATLAFDARRSDFFRRELIAALRIIDRGDAEPDEMIGSWAGALGQPQFMPSSYLAFAQDFDGDQRRDIWRSEADVFASIANYLAKNGWKGEGWGEAVSLPDELVAALPDLARTGKSGCRAIDQSSIELPMGEWRQRGVRTADGEALDGSAGAASLVRPDGDAGPSFLVGRNYTAILRYNCAHHYALTVGLLADLFAAEGS